MTALGLVEGVKRTMYRDNAFNVSAYPLDTKIGLLNIDGSCSRYSQIFSWNVAKLYAELTEAEAVSALHSLLGIEINQTQVARVSQAVAKKYIHHADADSPNIQTEHAEEEESAEETIGEQCTDIAVKGFLAERLKELEARPDRDEIIQAAIDGKINGAEDAKPLLTALYVEADGTGVPGLRRELSDKGKNGGKASTFEAKIGCAFLQGFNANGLPVLNCGNIERIPETTKYTGTTNKIDGFCPQFAEFATQNGIHTADQVVFLSDGALWLKNMQMSLCPTAICIVDFFHAAEHLEDIIGELRFHSSEKCAEFAAKCRGLLEFGEIGQLAALIRSKMNSSNTKSVEKKLVYFERNADRMRYGLFRAAGLFIGSGVMEAACKTIVGKRLKNAGMHWSKANAEGLIALRCAICSNEYELTDDSLLAA